MDSRFQVQDKKDKKPPLIILAGPTAVGKTKLSIALAKAVKGQIISADSMQVYRGMDIGTAKIMPEEMNGVSHHLINVLEPTEDFHVVKFQELAKAALSEIYAAGDVPILVGGTGFYIQALLYDIDFSEQDEDTEYRQQLQQLAKEHGAEYLHQLLAEIDPESAKVIHANNIKRVIRALEFHHQTGGCISKHNEEQRKKQSPYNYLYFVLKDDRQKLYDRIDRRIDEMLEQGLVDEVAGLVNHGCTRDMVSMQGLGYKEILDYLDGSCTLEEAVYRLKRDTRHFAKRQLTWFKREPDVHWLNREDKTEDELLNQMLDLVKKQILVSENE